MEERTTNIFRDNWRRYRDLGMTPYPANGKDPVVPWKWADKEKTIPLPPPTEEDYERWAKEYPNHNIWIKLGDKKCVLEDEGEGRDFLYDLKLPDCPVVESGGKRRGWHTWFEATPGIEKQTFSDGNGSHYELRTGDHGMLVPPSVHPETGQPYRWIIPPEKQSFPAFPIEAYRKILTLVKKPSTTPKNNGGQTQKGIDVARYLSAHGIEHTIQRQGGGTAYLLRQCPFAAEHTKPNKHGDSSIFKPDNGPLSFTCFHAHCAGRTWEDVRKIISGEKSLRDYMPIPENDTNWHQAGAEEPETKEFSYLTLNLPTSLEISRLEITVNWIVRNLIPEESITLLHSIGGVGKTYLMYKIGKCVADGIPFFGLDVKSKPVYYIDFENPLPEIADRMKKIGGSDNLRIWHLGHEPMPVRFDANEWEIYKSFPPGLFIIDSLRSSHLLEENSSKDASFVMARHKELRSMGSTIFLIHHESKAGGYRGSTAWFDLADHILKFGRVRKIGSDEDVEDDDFTLPIRLGLGGKSRFSSAIELKPMYFKFEDHQLCSAENPDNDTLSKMAQLLGNGKPPNQGEFQELVKTNFGIGRKSFLKLLKKGESENLWFAKKAAEGNKFEYFRTP